MLFESENALVLQVGGYVTKEQMFHDFGHNTQASNFQAPFWTLSCTRQPLVLWTSRPGFHHIDRIVRKEMLIHQYVD